MLFKPLNFLGFFLMFEKFFFHFFPLFHICWSFMFLFFMEEGNWMVQWRLKNLMFVFLLSWLHCWIFYSVNRIAFRLVNDILLKGKNDRNWITASTVTSGLVVSQPDITRVDYVPFKCFALLRPADIVWSKVYKAYNAMQNNISFPLRISI